MILSYMVATLGFLKGAAIGAAVTVAAKTYFEQTKERR